MEWKAMKGITLTEIQRNVTLELTDREAVYLKTLVGRVLPSGLPHAQFARSLYDDLEKKFPGTPLDIPWKANEYGGLIACAADWDDLD